VAKKARDTIGANRAYSSGRDRKNKYSDGQKLPIRVRRQRRGNKKRLLCNGCG